MKLPTSDLPLSGGNFVTFAKHWLSGISAWVAFVHHRSLDRRFSLFGKPLGFVAILFSLAATIVLLVAYADPAYLAHLRSPQFESSQLFQVITRFGTVGWILGASGTVMIVLSLASAQRFKGEPHVVWHRLFLNAYFLFTSVAFSGLLGNLFKNAIGRARPQFTTGDGVWVSMPFEHPYQFASFPSGHSTTGGAIAMALALLFPRWRWLFLPAGALIALSRPVLGVHFPSDAVAGFAFGAIFVWVYARSFARKRLLFTYAENGKLALRGEWKGKGAVVRQMISQVRS